MKDKEKYLESSNNRIYEQLSYAEAKNGILVGLLGAVILALLGLAFGESTTKKIDVVLYIYSGIFGISLLISLWSFFPNTDPLDEKENLYFWGNIANFNSGAEYLNAVDAKTEQLANHLASQNVQVSRIIRRKHRLFSIALRIVVIAFIPPMIFYYFIKGIIRKN